MTPKEYRCISPNLTIYETCQLNKHAIPYNTVLLEMLTCLLVEKLLASYVTTYFITAFIEAGHCSISCAIFRLQFFWLFLISHICGLYASHDYLFNAVTQIIYCEYCHINISLKKKDPTTLCSFLILCGL